MAMAFAIGSIFFGLNFFFSNPTFNPYGIPYSITGAIFLVLGSSKLFAIVVMQNLKAIRVTMMLCAVWMMIWGAGTLITVYQGKTSFQNLIAFGLLAVLQRLLLREPFLNPMTRLDV